MTSVQRLDPTTIVIFGGTGDLFRRKLLFALLDLFAKNSLPKLFRIVGFSRRAFSDEEYRVFIREIIRNEKHQHEEQLVTTFLEHVFYEQGDFTQPQAYTKLHRRLLELDDIFDACPNRLLYLAVPPPFYLKIFEELCASGVGKESPYAWTRLLVEKPFGNDLESARVLDQKLGSLFKEQQIFRIDHYLAKDAIQNILTFRFANALFENSWNRESIERVHIKLFETIGVEERASFYNDVGALRDVGQNHMLQMLALVAMENPGVLQAETVRTNRADVLLGLGHFSPHEIKGRVVRAQYEGYRDITKELSQSCTETYFLVRASLHSRRWRGVPFFLESGKQLNEKRTEINVTFKPSAPCFGKGTKLGEYQNTLTIGIAPEQRVSIRFWGKKPGLTYALEPRDLSFLCGDKQEVDAYQKVLYDCIEGDQMLFTSTEEVDAAWRFVTPILKGWADVPLFTYKGGSKGPQERRTLINNS